jgi:hypothetical protein
VGRRRGNPPRNLSGKRTARARLLWKAGSLRALADGASHDALVVKLSGTDDRGGDLPPVEPTVGDLSIDTAREGSLHVR